MGLRGMIEDRKSTRLNSSHANISYAVFCLNDTATTEIYTLSLHDALPIYDIIGRQGEHHHDHAALATGDHKLVGGAFQVAHQGTVQLGLAMLVVAQRDIQLGDGLEGHDRRSEEHTSELQSRQYLVCRLLLE